MANPKSFIITHVATGMQVALSTFKISEFQDAISTKYDSESVFGRMDPIVTYQGATRKITVGLLMSPLDTDRAEGTLQAASKLMRMQYPVYEKAGNALTLARPPLVKVQFGNWIRSGDGGALLCAMNGFAYTPKVGYSALDSPYVKFGGEGTIDGFDAGTVISPKSITMKFDFTVLHETPMGFGPSECLTKNDPHLESELGFYGGAKFGPDPTNYPAKPAEEATADPDEEPEANKEARASCIFK